MRVNDWKLLVGLGICGIKDMLRLGWIYRLLSFLFFCCSLHPSAVSSECWMIHRLNLGVFLLSWGWQSCDLLGWGVRILLNFFGLFRRQVYLEGLDLVRAFFVKCIQDLRQVIQRLSLWRVLLFLRLFLLYWILNGDLRLNFLFFFNLFSKLMRDFSRLQLLRLLLRNGQ